MPTPSKRSYRPKDRLSSDKHNERHHRDRDRIRDRERDNDHHSRQNNSYKRSRPTENEYQNVRVKREPADDDHDHRRRRKDNRKLSNPFLRKSEEDKHEWGKPSTHVKDEEQKANIKPDFGLSGKLAEDTNTVNGMVIKYNEPSEARKPKRRWRLYPFKGEESLPVIPIHRQSAYLLGRARGIVDIPTDHPSCSKQQAVLQYRLVDYEKPDGRMGKRVRPYIIDLESANGTFVNNKQIEPKRYVELIEKDVLKFGFSSREYVVLHEESKYDEEDDNIVE